MRAFILFALLPSLYAADTPVVSGPHKAAFLQAKAELDKAQATLAVARAEAAALAAAEKVNAAIQPIVADCGDKYTVAQDLTCVAKEAKKDSK